MFKAASTIDQEQDRQHGVYFTRPARFQVATQASVLYVVYLGKLARGPVFTRWIHLRDSYRIFAEYLTLEVAGSVAGCRILLQARSISLKIGQFTFYEELSYNPRCTNRDIIVQIHPTVKLGLVRPVLILWDPVSLHSNWENLRRSPCWFNILEVWESLTLFPRILYRSSSNHAKHYFLRPEKNSYSSNSSNVLKQFTSKWTILFKSLLQ